MSIELHCAKCGKLIRAPDEAGGKRGKCPHCSNSVYIPEHLDDDDMIAVAPLDESEDERDQQLRRESLQFATSVGKDKSKAPATAKQSGSRDQPGEVVNYAAEVEQYILAMRDSKLDEVEKIVAKLKHNSARAKDYIEGMMLDQMAQPIADVPEPLLQGFLKSLIGRLDE